MEYLSLDYWQVGVAALLILVNGAISAALELGLGRKLLIASTRTVVQLLLVGLVLEWVFSLSRWWAVVLVAAVMATVAGVSAVRRTGRRFPGVWFNSLLSIWVSSWAITGLGLVAIIGVDPWYKPQYSIPLLGMMLGNALNGISLGLDRFGEELATGRGRIEGLLALGASRWEAARGAVRKAVSTGMIPIINSMMVVGIVSLPGMMTGQLLSGVPPAEATKYQVVIMFLIASTTALGAVGVVMLSYRRLFNRRHQFLYHSMRRVDDT